MAATRRTEYQDGGWSEQEHEDGRPHGWWRRYRANGRVEWERQYVRGREHGVERTYDPDGRVIEERRYAWGGLHGVWRRVDPSSGKVEERELRFGHPVESLRTARNPAFRDSILPLFDVGDTDPAVPSKDIWKTLLRPTSYLDRGARLTGDCEAIRSYIGHVNVAAPEESWPRHEGRPLSPILQLRADALPIRPPPWDRWTLLTIFAVPDGVPGTSEGDLVIRAYPSLDGLRVVPVQGEPLGTPSELSIEPPVDSLPDDNDLPSYLVASRADDPGVLPPLDSERDPLRSHACGWPGWLQLGRLIDLPPFALQVDSLLLPGWRCGDASILYVFGDGEEPPVWLCETC